MGRTLQCAGSAPASRKSACAARAIASPASSAARRQCRSLSKLCPPMLTSEWSTSRKRGIGGRGRGPGRPILVVLGQSSDGGLGGEGPLQRLAPALLERGRRRGGQAPGRDPHVGLG